MGVVFWGLVFSGVRFPESLQGSLILRKTCGIPFRATHSNHGLNLVQDFVHPQYAKGLLEPTGPDVGFLTLLDPTSRFQSTGHVHGKADFQCSWLPNWFLFKTKQKWVSKQEKPNCHTILGTQHPSKSLSYKPLPAKYNMRSPFNYRMKLELGPQRCAALSPMIGNKTQGIRVDS